MLQVNSSPPPPIIRFAGVDTHVSTNVQTQVEGGDSCDMANWICVGSSQFTSGVLLRIDAGQPISEFNNDVIADLIDTCSTLADAEASQIRIEVESLNAEQTALNVTISLIDDRVASAVAEELRAAVGTASAASERLAFAVVSAVVYVRSREVAYAWSVPTRSMLWSHTTATLEDASLGSAPHMSVAGIAFTTQETTMRLSNQTSSEDGLSYFHRLRAIASLHLVWALPVIGFLVMTCCCIWWCVSSHTIHDERENVCVAQDHRMDHGMRHGLVSVIDDIDVDEASAKLRSARLGHPT